jgi:hypothetical protein
LPLHAFDVILEPGDFETIDRFIEIDICECKDSIISVGVTGNPSIADSSSDKGKGKSGLTVLDPVCVAVESFTISKQFLGE